MCIRDSNCTVLFPTNEEGVIQPSYQKKIPGMHLLEKADLVILGLRFRNLPDEDMKFFDDYLESGRPIIATRTSTHSFRIPEERKYAKYSFNAKDPWVGGFGQQVLGDTWISHHGKHGKQSTRGVVNKKFADHPILKELGNVWGPTDVYGIKNLPEAAKVLLHGQVLEGMQTDSKAVDGELNDPMMPVAWTKTWKTDSGKESRIFCTTMGAATDFESEGLRRLIVNAAYWSLDLSIEGKTDVEIVDEYKPTQFGFRKFKKNRTAKDYDLKMKK